MEKKIGQVQPGKTYLLRFKPAGDKEWSKTYEFTAPTPGPDQLEEAAAGAGSVRVVTTVKMTGNKNFSARAACWWDTFIKNDYGAWSTGADQDKIYCLVDGWYEATACVTYNGIDTAYTSGDALYTTISHFTAGGTETILAGEGGYAPLDIAFFYMHDVSAPPRYCKAGDYFVAHAFAPQATGTVLTQYSSSTPISQMSVTYLGV
jgi:hypothetical protein